MALIDAIELRAYRMRRRYMSTLSKKALRRVGVYLVAGIIPLFGILVPALSSAAEGPIKVGIPIPLTGPYSSDGHVMDQAAKLAIKEINESGGLLGRQVKGLVFDIGDLTPDKLQAAGTYLVEKNHVDALINGYGGMGPDIPAFCPYKVPYIHNDATSNVVKLRDRLKCSNIFMGSDRDYDYGKITFGQILNSHKFGKKSLYVIHGPYDWERNDVAGASEYAKKHGWKVVGNVKVPYGVRQWQGIISKVDKSGASLVYMELLDPAGVKTFVKQYVESPAPGALLYVGYTLSVPAFQDVATSGTANGVLGMTLSAQRNNAAGKHFSEAWKKAYGHPPPLSVAAQVYDEVNLWAHAVKEAGNPRAFKKIQAELESGSYTGVTGTFRFNKQHYIFASDKTVPAQLLQVQHGAVVRVRVGTHAEHALVVPPWSK